MLHGTPRLVTNPTVGQRDWLKRAGSGSRMWLVRKFRANGTGPSFDTCYITRTLRSGNVRVISAWGGRMSVTPGLDKLCPRCAPDRCIYCALADYHQEAVNARKLRHSRKR